MEKIYKLDGGMTLTITQDLHPESPRECDSFGILRCEGFPMSRHLRGDEDAERPPISGAVILPVYAYVHGGITIRTDTPYNCKWDSGVAGVIYATHARIREEYDISRVTKKWREKVRGILRGEIETLNQYLQGDVWRFTLEDAEGDWMDSCGGFYGGDILTNGMLEHFSKDIQGQIKKQEND